MSQHQPVVVLGLDAAPPALIESWMEQGYLQNLKKLRERGTYGYLKNFDVYSTDVAWPTFATGCRPGKTGYWTMQSFVEGTYRCETRAAYDYEEYPPFFALGNDYRVAAFDLPQVPLNPKINGLQVAAWGAHSPQISSGSLPEPLFQEIVDRYGAHPTLNYDFALCLDLENTLNFTDKFLEGIAKRERICQDLLAQERWDLFLTVFSETHSAAHIFWQLSQPDHPYYEFLQPKVDRDPLLAVFERTDLALGKILESLPEEATLLLFSSHGMGPAKIDLPTFVFLPELLYRINFPGKIGLESTPVGTPVPPRCESMQWNYWERHVWNSRFDPNPLRRWLRNNTPTKAYHLLEPWLDPAPTADNPDLASPFHLGRQPDRMCPWMAVRWYQPFWPQMKAFAIPSFEGGQIRINLKGREPNGLVEPADYHNYCDELIAKIETLKDARTGIPMVDRVIRVRQNPLDRDPKLHHADLIVVWQEEHVSDVVESPEFGRIGPYPPYRAGSHTPEAFILACGPGIPAGALLAEEAHSLDVAPTILDLMGAPIPSYMDGKPIPLHSGSPASVRS